MVTDHLLVLVFTVMILVAATSMALHPDAGRLNRLIESVALGARTLAVIWLVATRGRARHPWTIATLLLVDITLLAAVFATIPIPYAREPFVLHSVMRLPLVCAALRRRQMMVVLPALLAGPSVILGWQMFTLGRNGITMPLLWLVTVGVTGYCMRRLAQHLATARAEALELAARRQHDALHDSLTGLPNRFLYADQLAEAVTAAAPDGPDVAVVLIDLDRFKMVNDSHGHQFGDEVLVAVSRRLRHSLRSGDTLARLGGDEFAVILRDIHEPADALAAAAHLGAALRDPLHPGGAGASPGTGPGMYVTASMGIAFARRHRDDLGAVLREADIAMYQAKARGQASVEIFDETMGRVAHRRLDLENQLRHDVETGSDTLSVAFQPIVEPAGGRIVGMEALARWSSPRYGAVPPDEFIAIAEECDIIHDLGRRVLRTALDHTLWWCTLQPTLEISVNVSPVQLHRPEFADEVRALLRQTRVPAEQVCLEITEGVLLDPYGASDANLRALHEAGLKLAVDDFGSGYSSLAQLRRFPVDKLKADRSFIDDAPLLQAVADLALALNAQALAEGVETPEQRRRLVELGYAQAQGYFFARPQPPAAVTELLRSQQNQQQGSSGRT
ncbi:putative signaling protein [Actinoplanes sp. SE50]|nr:putative signaling protein [Actinoplanes sp. SE50/110]ATO82748.1 putative signaling protein [Actinoplanes sp. SE50]SLM00155.1 putative signaling protein [Actinoplanes sp. SE50/110]